MSDSKGSSGGAKFHKAKKFATTPIVGYRPLSNKAAKSEKDDKKKEKKSKKEKHVDVEHEHEKENEYQLPPKPTVKKFDESAEDAEPPKKKAAKVKKTTAADVDEESETPVAVAVEAPSSKKEKKSKKEKIAASADSEPKETKVTGRALKRKLHKQKAKDRKKAVVAAEAEAAKAAEEASSEAKAPEVVPEVKKAPHVMSDEEKKLCNLLNPDLLALFKTKFEKFTHVQIRTGNQLLTYNDVVVESPTGSGKTLAFVLPTLTLMKRRRQPWREDEIGTLVLAPSKELAIQIAEVAKPFAEKLGFSVHLSIRGKKKPQDDFDNLTKKGGHFLVATPRRFEQLLSMDDRMVLKRMLRSIEVLIVDEADRFNEQAFSQSMTEIMSVLPKQRRTGLFSATQAKDRTDLVQFQLRAPISIKIKEQKDQVVPRSLKNYYTVCEAKDKMLTMLEFIRNKPEQKVIVFLSSCSCVAYFNKFFKRLLRKRPVFAVHGKQQTTRTAQIKAFRESSNGVMICTDVMSRGIDIDDIDWVIQFDVPRSSSWFVHRAGRTARCGREGAGLMILTPSETAYVDFVQQYEKIKLDTVKVPTVTDLKSEQLMEQIRKIASEDRETLILGTRSFVSFIEAYSKHDCEVVCQLKELDVVGIAHAYGLLRLPRMRELAGRTDLETFKRSDVDTSAIKFADAKQEQRRHEEAPKKHEMKLERKKEAKLRKERKLRNKLKADKREEQEQKDAEKKRSEVRVSDRKLMTKMKGGRLSQKELKRIED